MCRLINAGKLSYETWIRCNRRRYIHWLRTQPSPGPPVGISLSRDTGRTPCIKSYTFYSIEIIVCIKPYRLVPQVETSEEETR